MNKARILLVDDNQDMLIIGQRIFEKAGYRIIAAHTGEEGLEKARSESPDLILLDFLLPDMNGCDFIRKLAASEIVDLQQVPLIVLTAHPNTVEDLESCYALGLRACLNKPFGHRELVNVVENYLRSSMRAPAPRKTADDPEWLDDLKLATQAIR